LLHSLRDVTATVDSIPLIASSVMSKKIASGADAIVLDVKTGSGAFMKELDDARLLAKSMVAIGKLMGRNTTAVISDMNQPLGYAIGNMLEVREAIETLKGKGPEDLTELCLELGSHMAVLGGIAGDFETGRQMLMHSIESGKALETFRLFLESQGGNGEVIEHPEIMPQPKFKQELKAERTGYIESMQAEEIGHAAMLLGAGRETKASVIDLAAGIQLHKKTGDAIKTGEPLLTIYTNKPDWSAVSKQLLEAIKISPKKPSIPSLIHEIIQ